MFTESWWPAVRPAACMAEMPEVLFFNADFTILRCERELLKTFIKKWPDKQLHCK
jgi:hypothetical protein